MVEAGQCSQRGQGVPGLFIDHTKQAEVPVWNGTNFRNFEDSLSSPYVNYIYPSHDAVYIL